MSQPFFSICIPVYNGDDFVARAVDSVLAQTFRDFELVIYNNGSTDRTSQIIRAAAARDSRVRLLEEPKPVSLAVPAWARVMSLAQGRYILMLGHDDFFDPEFLAIAKDQIERHDLDVFSGDARCLDPNGAFCELTRATFLEKLARKETSADGLTTFAGRDFIDAFVRDFANGFSKLHLSTTFYRREVYEKAGGFNAGLKYCAEADLYLRLAEVGARFGYLSGMPLVSFVGTGPQRRAHFLDNESRFHDFFAIPAELQRRGLVDDETYRRELLSPIERLAIRHPALSLAAAAELLRQYARGGELLASLAQLFTLGVGYRVAGKIAYHAEKAWGRIGAKP